MSWVMFPHTCRRLTRNMTAVKKNSEPNPKDTYVAGEWCCFERWRLRMNVSGRGPREAVVTHSRELFCPSNTWSLGVRSPRLGNEEGKVRASSSLNNLSSFWNIPKGLLIGHNRLTFKSYVEEPQSSGKFSRRVPPQTCSLLLSFCAIFLTVTCMVSFFPASCLLAWQQFHQKFDLSNLLHWSFVSHGSASRRNQHSTGCWQPDAAGPCATVSFSVSLNQNRSLFFWPRITYPRTACSFLHPRRWRMAD